MTTSQKRIKNLISLIKYRFNQNKSKILSITIIIVLIFNSIKISTKNLKIYFIDVGQGDSCLIVSPQNKTILIDGGGSSNYDIGEKVLLPYLLDRGAKKLDYVMISHFDTDHCQGLLYILQKMKVRNVIIGKQFENSENYEEFVGLVKEKNINVNVVESGQRINIEKDLYFDVLWPDTANVIIDNVLNNNSLVCKLTYKDFSILFTGDIEEMAEKAILQKYKGDENMLNATVLKVAHHGSKTSSIQKFIEAVKCKIALIGVGEKNTFGHPNAEVLERLKRMWK